MLVVGRFRGLEDITQKDPMDRPLTSESLACGIPMSRSGAKMTLLRSAVDLSINKLSHVALIVPILFSVYPGSVMLEDNPRGVFVSVFPTAVGVTQEMIGCGICM